jgi:hypothetical protein
VGASFATSTSPVTLSGAGLDGALAGAALAPGRPVQIITGAAAGAYSTASPIVVTGTLDSGAAHTDRLYLTQANGGETVVGTWSFARVTQVAIPAQLLQTGLFTLGFYACPAAKLDSLVERACGLTDMRIRVAQVVTLQVDQPNERPRPYRALEVLLDVVEEHGIDPALHGELYDPDVASGIEATIAQGNLNPFNSFIL